MEIPRVGELPGEGNSQASGTSREELPGEGTPRRGEFPAERNSVCWGLAQVEDSYANLYKNFDEVEEVEVHLQDGYLIEGTLNFGKWRGSPCTVVF